MRITCSYGIYQTLAFDGSSLLLFGETQQSFEKSIQSNIKLNIFKKINF